MTTYYADKASPGGPVAVRGFALNAQHLHSKVLVPANIAVGDVLQMGFLPPNAVVASVGLAADQLDTNATGTFAFNVGDAGYSYMLNNVLTPVAGDPQRYFSAASVGRGAQGSDANTTATFNGRARMFKNLSNQKLAVFATITAAPATPQQGVLQLLVTYFVED